MAVADELDGWRMVRGDAAFIQHLSRLRRDLARRGADGETEWTANTVPDFFHCWSRWIDGALADGTYPELLAQPSWASLAGQLVEVRLASPRSGSLSAPLLVSEVDVTSAAGLAGWLRHLGDDCIDDDAQLAKLKARGRWAGEGRWAHGTDLDAYFEAWQACLVDNRDIGVSFGAETWSDLAGVLTLGQRYE